MVKKIFTKMLLSALFQPLSTSRDTSFLGFPEPIFLLGFLLQQAQDPTLAAFRCQGRGPPLFTAPWRLRSPPAVL